jgi:hypothetical protein
LREPTKLAETELKGGRPKEPLSIFQRSDGNFDSAEKQQEDDMESGKMSTIRSESTEKSRDEGIGGLVVDRNE